MEPLKVFIGYDPKEAVAYNVLQHSILVRSSVPVSITPIMLSQVGCFHNRIRDPKQSTDFSFSRFLTPYLSGYKGWSLFMDCDMLVLDDIAKVFARANDDYAVMCVKHDHKPKNTTKFLGALQTQYEKKNWSSFMLMNNEKCTALTPDYVETATGLELHQFKWLDDDALIGDLPHEWNCLVGYDDCYGAKCLHYTEGGPYFDDYGDVSHAADWYIEKNRMETVSTRL